VAHPDVEQAVALGVGAVLETIEMLSQHPDGSGIVQNPDLATKAPRLKKEDGLVDWSRSAVQIANQVRAFQPWPKTYTLWNRDAGEPLRLILEKVHPASTNRTQIPGVSTSPGTIVESHDESLLVATSDGLLQINAVQPAGKRVLTTAEFLRGYSVPQGTRWG
jgi:methionyl-tRNA formyltransferase